MNYETFIDLLHQLDDLLNKAKAHLTVHAIGGFAMICYARWNNVKNREISRGIDSLSTISDAVQKLIIEVAKTNNVNEDWLNDEWIKEKKGIEEFEYFAQWQKVDEGFSNLELRILDIETMFFFKMRDINNRIEHGVGREGSTPRVQDVQDVQIILKIMNEKDIHQIKNPKMRSCIQYFPYAVEWITQH